MPNKDDVQTRLDRLLRESAALRERSDALTKQAQRLREQVAKLDGQRAERRKKPRMKGK